MTDSQKEEKVTALEERKQSQPWSSDTETVSLLRGVTQEHRLVKTTFASSHLTSHTNT